MASDLHTHTTFSDGSYTPEELVAESKNIGLTYLAITDHDTVDGVKHLYENRIFPVKGLKIIPGIEFSAENPDHNVHLVGLNVDIYDGALSDMTNEILDARWTRFSEMIEKLREKKYDIKEADVLKIAGSSHSIGRSHIARAMVKKGIFKSPGEAFEKVLGLGKPCYVPRYFPTVDEIVEVVHNAGGEVCLAHPGLVGDNDLVRELCKKIDAIEVYYPSHKPEQTDLYKSFANEFGLKISGGSDFHGTASRFVDRLGEFTVADEVAKQFYREEI